MNADEVLIRVLAPDDLPALGAFRCSAGNPWEAVVEAEDELTQCQRVLKTMEGAWRAAGAA